MRYDEYLKAGYPIGSGVVESTCGHTVKGRMEGTGRRWSVKGAESILLLPKNCNPKKIGKNVLLECEF